MNGRVRRTIAVVTLFLTLFLAGAAGAAGTGGWPMKQKDMHNTGRADFTVPAERMNNTFFDVFTWQKPSPGSPGQGNFSSSSMVFLDGVGPSGEDVVVSGYHWPKGVQGMDRQTGALLWNGNPYGGETIGKETPAFSADGSAVYVVNDATSSASWPNGHPLMAFSTATGPSTYWHNGGNPAPNHMEMNSPTIAPDGRIFLHAWVDRPYGTEDNGAAITETWAADVGANCGYSDPALYDDYGYLLIVIGSRSAEIICNEDTTGFDMWSTAVDGMVDAPVTIDPDNGNIYVGVGDNDIYVAGLDIFGDPLWTSPSLLVYDYVDGTNNRQRAQSAGCLSHDGSTYYFQTNSAEGDGRLYAIDTSDGSVKWEVETGSLGWEIRSSSPIVTENDVVVVGNNEGDQYFAILDEGTAGTVLDSFAVNPDSTGNGHAVSSAVISPEGYLYLPLRTYWTQSNGDGDTPSANVANVFSAMNLQADAIATLPAPPHQTAVALNAEVLIEWDAVSDPGGDFDHYAVYRETSPFTNVSALTPIATISTIDSTSLADGTASNGVSYHYAVTTVTGDAGEDFNIGSIGPRTPFDETDLQIVCIARTPRYPRYDPTYTESDQTEPGGFGPYTVSAATGLGSGQDENSQRWPDLADPVTYTATIRNRGTNRWTGILNGTWSVDGAPQAYPSPVIDLAPNETVTVSCIYSWDAAHHEIALAIDPADSRPGNDTLSLDTRSVAFLSYIDRTLIEEFREETGDYPGAVTDDFIDWVNRHIAFLNQMFVAAGVTKRVHYDLLEVIGDYDADPTPNTIDFAIFPLRYIAGEPTLRHTGYYDAGDDIDYGLLHEWGHQLGLIDLYQLNVASAQNLVNGEEYRAPDCLMTGCSHFLSEHSANAMAHWADVAHGYYGQYMYSMPESVTVRLIDSDSLPLAGAEIKIYQLAERPGVGHVISTQVKNQGTTDGNGEWTLPNVEIDTSIVPGTFIGDTLRANPFGYLHVVGTNALLLLEVTYEGFTDYAWLDVTEVNNAFRDGETGEAIFDKRVNLGNVEYFPPSELTELNAASWETWAGQGSFTACDDTLFTMEGEGSIRVVETGGFDNYLLYPGDHPAVWDLSASDTLHAWFYAENPSTYGFQNNSPWIYLRGPNGSIELHPNYEVLNDARDQWLEVEIPLAGNAAWIRTDYGTVDLTDIREIEIHVDTWDAGFTLWIDGLRFEPQATTGIADESGAIPARTTLNGNVPNPFNPVTTIRFELREKTAVELLVYDIRGRLVSTLIRGPVAAGRHQIVWQGRDDSGEPLPSGVYLCRMNANGESRTRKMLMLK